MCEAPKRCYAKKEVRAIVSGKCATAEAKALRLSAVTTDLTTCQTQRDDQAGQTRILERQLSLAMQKPTPHIRSPWVLRWGLDIGIGAAGTTTGALLGSGAPIEWVVGFGVGAVALLVGRLILEALDR